MPVLELGAAVLSLGGVAGAVEDESGGVLGVVEVDCCFEQATSAMALRHSNKTLRFIDHLTGVSGRARPDRLGGLVGPENCRKTRSARIAA
ncbi:MAG TPA: hypothetical protein VIY54_00405 [Steroidobacteraceae bacterium]